jgi:hypothetical protein
MVVCQTCGQLSLLLEPGVLCLRKYDDYKQTCQGIMVEIEMTRAERQAQDRQRRKEKGICRQCSEELDPKSIVFCEEHLMAHRKKARLKNVRTNV